MLVAASYAYPPLRYPRAIQVARLLSQLPPDETIVVCGEEPGDGDTSLLSAYPDDGRRVIRVPWGERSLRWSSVRARVSRDRLIVPDHFRPWQRDAAAAIRGQRLLQRGDVFVTFGQPMSDHLLGLRLARRQGARWIAHFSDPWVDSPFFVCGPVARRLNERLERLVVERADALVFTSTETVDLVLGKYAAALRLKAHVIPHAHDTALYPAVRAPGPKVLARYVGNFYGHRDPEPLVQALRVLAAERLELIADLRVELVGSSQHTLRSGAFEGLPSGLVTVREPVDYVESLALMRESDLLLLVDAPGERSVFLPSKLIDYLGARRPIFAITPEGPAASLVRTAGGWSADASEPQGVAACLVTALSTIRRGIPDRWGLDTVVDAYAAPRIAAQFRAIIETVRAS